MLNLERFTLRELQNTISLLEQFKGVNVVTVQGGINYIESIVQEQVEAKRRFKAEQIQAYRKQHKTDLAPCPDCEDGFLFPIKNTEGLNILGCEKCRYSEIREGKNVK